MLGWGRATQWAAGDVATYVSLIAWPQRLCDVWVSQWSQRKMFRSCQQLEQVHGTEDV